MYAVLYAICTLLMLSMCGWAYQQYYATQEVAQDIQSLKHDIAELSAAFDIQQAEWAYLNSPDRLRNLADLHFDTLGLLSITSQHFGDITTIPERRTATPTSVLPTSEHLATRSATP